MSADPLSLARQFLALAEVESNRPAVAQMPGVVSGLVSFLETTTNRELQCTAADALDLLAQTGESSKHLLASPTKGLIEKALIMVFTSTDPASPQGTRLRDACTSINTSLDILSTVPDFPTPRAARRSVASRMNMTMPVGKGLGGILKTSRISLDHSVRYDEIEAIVRGVAVQPGVLSVTQHPDDDHILIISGSNPDASYIDRVRSMGYRATVVEAPALKSPVVTPSKGRQLTIDGYVSPEATGARGWFGRVGRVGRRLWQ
ncbi:hypothetical protein J8273_4728 [Carpediemonas membranifera]|uniref:Uncharacterized protein n=1 Tax=Carpediemonas membranifera TaxID=201153 RepID=A0A8J6DZN0_9EUKA|nr:hypothetical protein J8273_4728 [Carpediemonas membranifera]|eukprot:KAG9393864.1 hypothetical protein J8273_4728 [Carpediemonas membranifera]